jgi:hypothetical protein
MVLVRSTRTRPRCPLQQEDPPSRAADQDNRQPLLPGPRGASRRVVSLHASLRDKTRSMYTPRLVKDKARHTDLLLRLKVEPARAASNGCPVSRARPLILILENSHSAPSGRSRTGTPRENPYLCFPVLRSPSSSHT